MRNKIFIIEKSKKKRNDKYKKVIGSLNLKQIEKYVHYYNFHQKNFSCNREPW